MRTSTGTGDGLMTYAEAVKAVLAAEAWCDSRGDGPQPMTFGALAAAALRIIHGGPGQVRDRTSNGTLASELGCTHTGCERKAVVIVTDEDADWVGHAACPTHISDVVEDALR